MPEHRPTDAAEHRHDHFLPAMGHDWLLPLYDPLTQLAGVRRAHRRLLDQAALEPGQRVLEIGCGTANLLLLAARRHPGATLVGLDPDPRGLERARRKARRAGVSVQLDRGSAAALPYPDGSTDRVLSSLMLHHIGAAERPAVLAEVRRVLAPGGALHLLDFEGAEHPRRGTRHAPPGTAGDPIPALLREAGFADVRRTGGGRLLAGLFGRYALYRAAG